MIKSWFLTEGKFATVLIIPSSWGSQLGGYPACIRSHWEKEKEWWRRIKGREGKGEGMQISARAELHGTILMHMHQVKNFFLGISIFVPLVR
jgi:hypothetical protein